MRNSSCFNLPTYGRKSAPNLRKPQFFCNRKEFFTTLEPRSNRRLGMATVEKTEKTESFLKKTHNKFQVPYSKSPEELLYNEAEQILSKPETHYLDLAQQLQFDEWQTKLLMRDLTNLKETLSFLPSWEQRHHQKKSFRSFFRVIREFLSETENVENKKMIQGLFRDLLMQMFFNQRMAYQSMVISRYDIYDEYLPELKKVELILKNIQIKTHLEGYKSSTFKEHPYGKFEPLYFNALKKFDAKKDLPYSLSLRRYVKEIDESLRTSQNSNYLIIPSNQDIRIWTGVIVGAPGTDYHGGVFYLSIELTKLYPFAPPIIKFLNKIFHPQIDESGVISLDILNEKFTPALTVEKIIRVICDMLANPNPTYFVSNFVKDVYSGSGDPKKVALEYVEKYA